MKIVPLAEKDQYTYVAIEDLGDGTCRLYEPEDEAHLKQFGFIVFCDDDLKNSISDKS